MKMIGGTLSTVYIATDIYVYMIMMIIISYF